MDMIFFLLLKTLAAFRYLLIGRIIVSLARTLLHVDHEWLPKIEEFLHITTEWFLGPIRSKIPPMGMMDMSVLVSFIIISILENVLPEFCTNFDAII